MDHRMIPTHKLEHSRDKYRNNPDLENLHRQGDAYRRICASIKKEGIINPLVVQTAKVNGKYKIVLGNNRWLAAKELGIKEVPVHIGDYDRPELKRIPREDYKEVSYGN